jgi:hypothetical protein
MVKGNYRYKCSDDRLVGLKTKKKVQKDMIEKFKKYLKRTKKEINTYKVKTTNQVTPIQWYLTNDTEVTQQGYQKLELTFVSSCEGNPISHYKGAHHEGYFECYDLEMKNNEASGFSESVINEMCRFMTTKINNIESYDSSDSHGKHNIPLPDGFSYDNYNLEHDDGCWSIDFNITAQMSFMVHDSAFKPGS